MIEVKRESLAAEHSSRDWEAWKARQKQAAAEGKLATEEDYAWLRGRVREIIYGSTSSKVADVSEHEAPTGGDAAADVVNRSGENPRTDMAGDPQVNRETQA